MNYKNYIHSILENRGRFNCEGYKERHHIKPKCIGGTDEKENLIDLYASEHYEAHKLLALENPDDMGLAYAWFMMSKGGGSTKSRRVASPEEYEKARKQYIKLLSQNFSGSKNPMYGVDRSGENNPMYGVHRYGDKSPMYGKNHTKDSKDKISKARKGIYTGTNHPFYGKRGKLHHASVVILQFNKDGTLIKEWESAGEAHRELGLDKSGILRCCNKQVLTCGNFIWIKKADYNENYVFPNFKELKHQTNKGKNHTTSKSVVQMTKDGEFIKIWDCMSDAEREINISVSRISLCCKHPEKHKTAGGYKWMYKVNYGKKRK